MVSPWAQATAVLCCVSKGTQDTKLAGGLFGTSVPARSGETTAGTACTYEAQTHRSLLSVPLSLFWGPLCTLAVVSGPWGEAFRWFCVALWADSPVDPSARAAWRALETWGDTSRHGVNEDYPFQTELTTETGPHRPALAPAATPRAADRVRGVTCHSAVDPWHRPPPLLWKLGSSRGSVRGVS